LILYTQGIHLHPILKVSCLFDLFSTTSGCPFQIGFTSSSKKQFVRYSVYTLPRVSRLNGINCLLIVKEYLDDKLSAIHHLQINIKEDPQDHHSGTNCLLSMVLDCITRDPHWTITVPQTVLVCYSLPSGCPYRVKPKTRKLAFVISPLSTQH
jgi:hypothetical protein